MSEEIVKLLRSLAKTFELEGFPKEPFIVQSDTRDSECFFICLWRNTGNRKVEMIEIE